MLVAASCFLLVGCQASNPGLTAETAQLIDSITQTPTIQNVDDAYISFTVANVDLKISRPQGWEFYQTDYGIVLAEYIGSVATDGRLDGLLTHVFVPPVDEFSLPVGEGNNMAWWILSQITQSPAYVGNAIVNAPVAFDWGGQDAAYYLMDNGEGNVTLVVGVIAPDTGHLVACSISAPVAQAERLREAVPALLDQMTINDRVLEGRKLDFLPDPLVFPRQ